MNEDNFMAEVVVEVEKDHSAPLEFVNDLSEYETFINPDYMTLFDSQYNFRDRCHFSGWIIDPNEVDNYIYSKIESVNRVSADSAAQYVVSYKSVSSEKLWMLSPDIQ